MSMDRACRCGFLHVFYSCRVKVNKYILFFKVTPLLSGFCGFFLLLFVLIIFFPLSHLTIPFDHEGEVFSSFLPLLID